MVVPDLKFYREKDGLGYEGDHEINQLRRLFLLKKYYDSHIFKYTFLFKDVLYNHIFSYEKDLVNNFEPKAWKVVSNSCVGLGFDQFEEMMENDISIDL